MPDCGRGDVAASRIRGACFTIPVLMPAAGSVWAFGMYVQISWIYPGPVNIVLVQGATVVRRLATGVPPQVATGLGVFMWQVPNTLSPANNYQVSAESTRTRPRTTACPPPSRFGRPSRPPYKRHSTLPRMDFASPTTSPTTSFVSSTFGRAGCAVACPTPRLTSITRRSRSRRRISVPLSTPHSTIIFTDGRSNGWSRHDKWAELTVNPFGARNTEFFNWGLQGSGGDGSRNCARRSTPASPCLSASSRTVAASGTIRSSRSDTTRATTRETSGPTRSSCGSSSTTPTHRARSAPWHPIGNAQVYYLVDAPQSSWRTYFVDAKYDRLVPPTFAAPPPVVNDGLVREVRLAILTGGDDLRGGNDNVDATLHFRNLPARTWPNINGSRRWIDNYQQTVSLSLSQAMRPEDILGVTLTTNFGGGIGGDNWNVNRLEMSAVVNGKSVPLLMREGTAVSLHRGQQDIHRISVRGAGPNVCASRSTARSTRRPQRASRANAPLVAAPQIRDGGE